jgi:hypothetical protein
MDWLILHFRWIETNVPQVFHLHFITSQTILRSQLRFESTYYNPHAQTPYLTHNCSQTRKIKEKCFKFGDVPWVKTSKWKALKMNLHKSRSATLPWPRLVRWSKSKTFCYYSCKFWLVETCLQHPKCVRTQHILLSPNWN